MRADDELSFCGSASTKSRGSSHQSATSRGFAIDWDEIDSIAEESVSVASSVSSGHRKRKTASSRRRNQSSTHLNHHHHHHLGHLEALETGSLSRGFGESRNNNSNSSGATTNNNSHNHNRRNNSLPLCSRRAVVGKSGDALRKLIVNMKKMGSTGAVLLVALVSLHLCCSLLSSNMSWGGFTIGIGNGVDRQARRMLTRSSAQHYHSKLNDPNHHHHWPISVRDEQDDFEVIPHPANDQVAIAVPRFYLTSDATTTSTTTSMQAMQSGFSKKIADMVGTTTVTGSRDFSVRTIFVAIASYRDWHCRYTIESVFARAKYPERLRVGVVDQMEPNTDPSCDLPVVPCSSNPDQALCKYRGQIDVYEMEAHLAVGPTFARHIVQRMYRGEYYALQIDSHTVFSRHWDTDIVQQLENTGNEMAVLTNYLSDAVGSVDKDTGKVLKDSRLVICNANFEGTGRERRLRHDIQQQPDILPAVDGMPQLQPYFSSDFAFSRGHFVLTVPYDPFLPMVQKDDEEVSMAIRGFTHGYDFYTPQRSVAFDSSYSDRDTRKSFLRNRNQYKGFEESSLQRLYGLIDMNSRESEFVTDPEEMFGMGRLRSITKFFNSFGIHPNEHITERKLCNFVSTGRMHRLFHEQHLRSDVMGIDYDSIHFRFHELQNNHEGGT